MLKLCVTYLTGFFSSFVLLMINTFYKNVGEGKHLYCSSSPVAAGVGIMKPRPFLIQIQFKALFFQILLLGTGQVSNSYLLID
jgi:hypothetical protein